MFEKVLLGLIIATIIFFVGNALVQLHENEKRRQARRSQERRGKTKKETDKERRVGGRRGRERRWEDYKEAVNAQIEKYNKLKGKLSEQEILNHLITTRITACSDKEKEEAQAAYGYLIDDEKKTLEDVIKAIVKYEYFESAVGRKELSAIPEGVEQIRREYMEYIERQVSK